MEHLDGSLRDKKYPILDSYDFLPRYSAIARSRSFDSSQGSRHISLSAARCLCVRSQADVRGAPKLSVKRMEAAVQIAGTGCFNLLRAQRHENRRSGCATPAIEAGLEHYYSLI